TRMGGGGCPRRLPPRGGEIAACQGALVLARLFHRAVIELGAPGLIGASAILGEREPHEAARGLARNMIALKQHGTEHRLRLALTFLCREAEPSRCLARIARSAGAVEIQPRQIILRVGIAEV